LGVVSPPIDRTFAFGAVSPPMLRTLAFGAAFLLLASAAGAGAGEGVGAGDGALGVCDELLSPAVGRLAITGNLPLLILLLECSRLLIVGAKLLPVPCCPP